MAIKTKRNEISRGDVARIGLPGTILGIGLGGFVDGILLHQILQWHHMLTSTDTDNVGIEYYPAIPSMDSRSTPCGTVCSTPSRGWLS